VKEVLDEQEKHLQAEIERVRNEMPTATLPPHRPQDPHHQVLEQQGQQHGSAAAGHSHATLHLHPLHLHALLPPGPLQESARDTSRSNTPYERVPNAPASATARALPTQPSAHAARSSPPDTTLLPPYGAPS